MSHPIAPKPAQAAVSRSILRRLSAVDVSHDFDVIGDAPKPQQREQPAEEPPPTAK